MVCLFVNGGIFVDGYIYVWYMMLLFILLFGVVIMLIG